MGILQRYILTELVRVFLLALAAFTSIFAMVGLVQEATRQGLSLTQILVLVPSILPASLPFTIPATLLLAVTVVYGRLAADNEIVAAKSAGINVLYLIVPAVLLGILLSFVTLHLYNHLIPAANFRVRTAFVDNVEDVVYAALKREHVIRSGSLPYEIYVQDVRGRKLINPIVKRRAEGGVYDLIVIAPEAQLEFDIEKKVVNVHMFDAQARDGDMNIIAKGDQVIPITVPNIWEPTKGIRDMTPRDLDERKARMARNEEATCARWAFNASSSIVSGHLHQIRWSALGDLAQKQRDLRRDLRRLECEPYLRRAISFGCLFFVLLGCPVAILFQRGDYLSAFISCFLPVIAMYYPLLMFGLNLSKEGHAPLLIMWFGNAVVALLALLAFRPVLRH